jgi:hypothetical protein
MGEKDTRKNLTVRKGRAVSFKLTIKEDGQAINITGYTVYFTAKEKIEDADSAAKINKKITEHSNPSIGETIITLSSTDMDIPVGHYLYAVDYKDDSGNDKFVVDGRLEVKKPVRDTLD